MRDGRRILFGVLTPGDVVGGLPEHRSSCTLAAATDAEICIFPAKAVKQLMEEDTAVRASLLQKLERQMADELTLACLRVTMSCRQKVAASLLQGLAASPHRSSTPDAHIVRIPVGRRDWADLCNTTVESISRQLSSFSAEGVVRSLGRGRYEICDLAALMEIAGVETSRIEMMNGTGSDPMEGVQSAGPDRKVLAWAS